MIKICGPLSFGWFCPMPDTYLRTLQCVPKWMHVRVLEFQIDTILSNIIYIYTCIHFTSFYYIRISKRNWTDASNGRSCHTYPQLMAVSNSVVSFLAAQKARRLFNIFLESDFWCEGVWKYGPWHLQYILQNFMSSGKSHSMKRSRHGSLYCS